ncbi:MAG TPA: peptidylprolyl isomerase [Thermoanaerobaculia bacterium]|nr:peptidylprolyl isomerase [Thermoanaerobaculia bacterium]
MTTRTSSPPLQRLLSLPLAFLMAGLIACSPASEGEQTAAKPADPKAPAAATAAPGQTAAPAQPGAAAPAPTTPAVAPDKMPAVVAKVNGEEIKKDQLLDEANKLKAQLDQAGQGQQASSPGFYREVLDGIIARTLLGQAAKSQGVTITDEEAKKEVDQLKSRFPNPEAFQQALTAQKMTEQGLLAEARRQMAVQKYVETKILNALTVTDAAAKDFYEKNKEQMKRPEQVHARHILIRVDPKATDADKQKAKAKAQDILARAKKGEDFAKLASENSEDPGSKGNGGDLSWFSHGQMVEAFDKAAFALQPNQISDLVETQFGYHIIQTLERKPESVVPFEEAKARIEQYLKQRQTQEAVQARIQELRTQGKVETFI